jgi:hypothetical protein
MERAGGGSSQLAALPPEDLERLWSNAKLAETND